LADLFAGDPFSYRYLPFTGPKRGEIEVISDPKTVVFYCNFPDPDEEFYIYMK
jgi:hypothetical protein